MLVYLIARGHGMTERAIESQQEMQRQQDDYIKSVAGSSAGSSAADQIASAKALLDAGTITAAGVRSDEGEGPGLNLIRGRAEGPAPCRAGPVSSEDDLGAAQRSLWVDR